MKLSKLTLFILAAFTASPVWSADLLETYHTALDQDAAIASARAAQLAGKEKLTQGRSGLLPSINLSANMMQNQFTYQVAGFPPIPDAKHSPDSAPSSCATICATRS